jgi:hypothetical protein
LAESSMTAAMAGESNGRSRSRSRASSARLQCPDNRLPHRVCRVPCVTR